MNVTQEQMRAGELPVRRRASEFAGTSPWGTNHRWFDIDPLGLCDVPGLDQVAVMELHAEQPRVPAAPCTSYIVGACGDDRPDP